jgi:hypothetical protein
VISDNPLLPDPYELLHVYVADTKVRQFRYIKKDEKNRTGIKKVYAYFHSFITVPD